MKSGELRVESGELMKVFATRKPTKTLNFQLLTISLGCAAAH